MPSCPKCEAYLSPLEYADNKCSNCAPAATESVEPTSNELNTGAWRDAAKLVNLAEAGYLVSCLEQQGLAARLVQAESFSAVTGTWDNKYVLQVAASSITEALEIVRSESEQIRNEEPEYDEFGEPIESEPVHLVFWRPIALMAVAGLATLWLGQRVAEQRQRVAPNRNAAALGDALEALGEPLIVVNEDGQTKHRLRFRPQDRTWRLESDTDGDGQLERKQTFTLEFADR